MKPASFRGPTGVIFHRIKDKKKTVRELGVSPLQTNINALACVKREAPV